MCDYRGTDTLSVDLTDKIWCPLPEAEPLFTLLSATGLVVRCNPNSKRDGTRCVKYIDISRMQRFTNLTNQCANILLSTEHRKHIKCWYNSVNEQLVSNIMGKKKNNNLHLQSLGPFQNVARCKIGKTLNIPSSVDDVIKRFTDLWDLRYHRPHWYVFYVLWWMECFRIF